MLSERSHRYLRSNRKTDPLSHYLNSKTPLQDIVDKEKQDGLDAAASSAKKKLVSSIEKGDYYSASVYIAALESAGKDDDSIKTAVGNVYRDVYKELYANFDDEEAARLEEYLLGLDVGITKSQIKGWRQAVYKTGVRNK